MTDLRTHAAQLVFPRLGSRLEPEVSAEDDVDRFEELLERCPVGGLILFNAEAGSLPAALRRLQKKSEEPLFVCADIERGVGQQVMGATVFPHAAAVGRAARKRAEAAVEVGRSIAREALGCGIHIGFVPVADVDSQPDNPIISIRAFGEETEEVGRCVAGFIRGAREVGLYTTAKHFPGHGATTTDSHETLPTVEADFETLTRRDLPPFEQAVESGVEAMMTAHVRFPQLDGDTPATASRVIIQDLLRGKLRFDGLVVTDSLRMGGILEERSAAEMAPQIVAAGVDILLDPPDPEAVVEELVRAVEEGTLTRERIETSAARIRRCKEALKRRFSETVFLVPPRRLQNETGADVHHELAAAIARDGVEVHDPEQLLERQEGRLCVVVVRAHDGSGTTRLESALMQNADGLDYHELGPESGEAQHREAAAAWSASERRVLVRHARPAAWQQAHLDERQHAWCQERLAEGSALAVGLGRPLRPERWQAAAARIDTYSDVPASQQVLADLLTGVHSRSAKRSAG